MKVCVEIEVDTEAGTVTVGVCPPEEEANEPKGYMKPAASVDAALQTAKSLLSNPQPQQPDQAATENPEPASPPAQGSAQSPMTEEQAASQRFGQIRGGR